MVNPISPSEYGSAQQQAPQQRGSSKGKKAFTNGVLLGGAGAILGATAFAPKKIDSGLKLLEQDTVEFNKNLQVPEKAPQEAKNAYKFLVTEKNNIDAEIAKNDAVVNKMFTGGKTAIEVDEALKFKYSEYSSVADAKNHIAALASQDIANEAKLSEELEKLKVQDKAKENLLKALQEKKGSAINKESLAEMIKNSGYEGDIQKLAVKKEVKWYNPFSWFGNKKLKSDDVIKKITESKIVTAEELKSAFKLKSDSTKELQEFVALLEDPKLITEGKLSRETYISFVEAKNPVHNIKQEVEPAFDLVKKYIKNNKLRGQGALRIGGIGLAAGVLLGLLFGGKKKE